MSTAGVRRIAVISLCIGSGFLLSHNMSANPQQFEGPHGAVEHGSTSAMVTVIDNTRPLLTAMSTMREEYGWKVDLEEAPHTHYASKTEFQSTYPESAERITFSNAGEIRAPLRLFYHYSLPPSSKASILNKVVSDYNREGFPDQYEVISQADGSYAVVGTAIETDPGLYRSVTPLLDTPVSIPNGPTTLSRAIQAIAQALTGESGIKVLSNPPMGIARTAPVTVNGDMMPARLLLQQIMPDSVWDLYYSQESHLYVLNVDRHAWAQYDQLGQRTP